MSPSAGKMTPAQQAAAMNAQARALIKARAVKMKQAIFNQSSIVPANTPVVNISPRNVGLILGFMVKVVHTVSNQSGVTINLADFGASNSLAQIVFTDLNNNVRIQTSGLLLNAQNTVRGGRPFGTAILGAAGGGTGWDSPVNYGSNWTVNKAPASITATNTGTVTMWYWVPLAYSDDDLRGAVYANVINATMQLSLSLPGTFGTSVAVQNGTDSTLAMFVGAAAGSVSAVSITGTTVEVYQYYLDQLPVLNGQVVLPVTDLATIYELKYSVQQNVPVGQDFGYQYPNFRDILSTTLVYVNNGSTGARGTGADLNYLELLAANVTPIWKVEPALAALETRQKIQGDTPPGMYYFDSRRKPISTTQYGNMQVVINAITAASNPYEIVGIEDFALVQTLSMAGSLPTS